MSLTLCLLFCLTIGVKFIFVWPTAYLRFCLSPIFQEHCFLSECQQLLTFPLQILWCRSNAVFQTTWKSPTSYWEKCIGKPLKVRILTCELGTNRSKPTSQSCSLLKCASYMVSNQQTVHKTRRLLYLPACNQNTVCGHKNVACMQGDVRYVAKGDGLVFHVNSQLKYSPLHEKPFQDNVTHFSLSVSFRYAKRLHC